jgi:hypothetical protein
MNMSTVSKAKTKILNWIWDHPHISGIAISIILFPLVVVMTIKKHIL